MLTQTKPNSTLLHHLSYNFTLTSIIILLLVLENAHAQQSDNSDSYSNSVTNSTKINMVCQSKCFGQITCKQLCIKNMEEQERIALYIGLSVGGVSAILIILTVVIVVCYIPCLCCPCHIYQKLKDKQNMVCKTAVSIKEYIKNRDKLIEILNTPSTNSKFTFNNGSKLYSVTDHKFQIVQQRPFITKIRVKGIDQCYAKWVGLGYILQQDKVNDGNHNNKDKSCGLKFWMYKTYKNGKICSFNQNKHILFKMSSFVEGDKIKGRWYCLSPQQNKQKQIKLNQTKHVNKDKSINNHKTQQQQVKQGKWQIKIKPNYHAMAMNDEFIKTTQAVNNTVPSSLTDIK